MLIVNEFMVDKSDFAKKIIKMIAAPDKEMAILGLKLLFDKGRDYIIKNIPSIGSVEIEEEGIITTHHHDDVFYKRGDIHIRISGCIDCRIATSLSAYKVVEI